MCVCLGMPLCFGLSVCVEAFKRQRRCPKIAGSPEANLENSLAKSGPGWGTMEGDTIENSAWDNFIWWGTRAPLRKKLGLLVKFKRHWEMVASTVPLRIRSGSPLIIWLLYLRIQKLESRSIPRETES